mgnify:CR=1 FL=1
MIIGSKRFLKINLKILFFLIIFHIISEFIRYVPLKINIFKLFNFDYESNLPSIYTSILFLFAFIEFELINLTLRVKESFFQLRFLSLLCLFLGLDELFMIHENFSITIGKFLNYQYLIIPKWLIIYSIAFLIIAIYLFLNRNLIPRKVNLILSVSSIIYFFGAGIFELISSNLLFFSLSEYNHTILNMCLILIEETLEILALILLNFGLIDYIQSIRSKYIIRFKNK